MVPCHLEAGNSAAALACAARAKETSRLQHGPDSMQVVQAWELESAILRLTGDLRGAVTASKEAWMACSRALGDDNPRTCNAYAALNRITAESVKVERQRRRRQQQQQQKQPPPSVPDAANKPTRRKRPKKKGAVHIEGV